MDIQVITRFGLSTFAAHAQSFPGKRVLLGDPVIASMGAISHGASQVSPQPAASVSDNLERAAL